MRRIALLFSLFALALPVAAGAQLSGGGGGMPNCVDGILGATYTTGGHPADHYTCVYGNGAQGDYWAWTGRY